MFRIASPQLTNALTKQMVTALRRTTITSTKAPFSTAMFPPQASKIRTIPPTHKQPSRGMALRRVDRSQPVEPEPQQQYQPHQQQHYQPQQFQQHPPQYNQQYPPQQFHSQNMIIPQQQIYNPAMQAYQPQQSQQIAWYNTNVYDSGPTTGFFAKHPLLYRIFMMATIMMGVIAGNVLINMIL